MRSITRRILNVAAIYYQSAESTGEFVKAPCSVIASGLVKVSCHFVQFCVVFFECMYVCISMCVCACVRVCMRACVHACL